MGTQEDNVFTIDELAKYLKLKKSTVYRLAQTQRIPGIKIGRHWRFHRGAIDAWLRREKESGHATAAR